MRLLVTDARSGFTALRATHNRSGWDGIVHMLSEHGKARASTCPTRGRTRKSLLVATRGQHLERRQLVLLRTGRVASGGVPGGPT